MCLNPFSSSGGPNGPTERAQIKSCEMEIDITVDGGGHVLRTNTMLLCRGMRKGLSFVLVWLARPKILDGPKDEFFPRNGTNGHEKPRSVPSGSTRSNRVKTRHHVMPCMAVIVRSWTLASLKCRDGARRVVTDQADVACTMGDGLWEG